LNLFSAVSRIESKLFWESECHTNHCTPK